jgi:hypothetical protein
MLPVFGSPFSAMSFKPQTRIVDRLCASLSGERCAKDFGADRAISESVELSEDRIMRPFLGKGPVHE